MDIDSSLGLEGNASHVAAFAASIAAAPPLVSAAASEFLDDVFGGDAFDDDFGLPTGLKAQEPTPMDTESTSSAGFLLFLCLKGF